jgi:hypothetical protein
VDPAGGDVKGAAEKLIAFWRLDKHMFVETLSDSKSNAALFDFRECSMPRI